jgi:hypothetical protein
LKAYADTSFLVRIRLTQSDSQKALVFMRDFRDPLHRPSLWFGLVIKAWFG